MLLVRQKGRCKGRDSFTLLGTFEKVGDEMIKYCEICGQQVNHKDRVVVGIVTEFIQLPSSTTWAIEKPEQFIYVNHSKCEGLDD